MMARKASRLASAVLTALMSVTVAAARTKGPKPTCECRLIQQKDSGISLVVLDQHGAVIPKAEITLQKQSASETIADVTGTSGEWNHGILAAGQYQITVKSPGFRTFSSIIEVRNGARLALKIKLPVADVKVMVEVKAEPTEVVGIATVGILAETKTSPLPPMLSEGQRFPMQP